MPAQSQLSPSQSPIPTQTVPTQSDPGRSNRAAQDQLSNSPAAQKERLLQEYADRLWDVATEISGLTDMNERQRAARAILGQAVEVQEEIELGEPVEIERLPRIPEGNQGAMPLRAFPPRWIRPARLLLDIAGGTGAAAGFGESDQALPSASGSSLFDSLMRMGRDASDYGVNRYQTQSNNLAAPEATCNATSMAMVLERLGYSREDLINAIELKLKRKQEETRLRKEGVAEGEIPKKLSELDYSCIYLSTQAWKDRVLQYLRTENGPKRGQNYQKLRGGAQGEKQLQSWAGEFKENAGMDDLVHFMLDLLNLERTAINAGENPGKVLKAVNAARPGKAEPSSERIDAGGANTWAKTKVRVQTVLEDGGAAMISIRHKGRGNSGTHIVAIQDVEADGLRVDDPYGNVRPNYDANKVGDAFSTNGGGRDRKNMVEADAGDWKMSAPLQDNEIKGQSNHWSDQTVQSAWQYVILFRTRSEPPATTPNNTPAAN